MAHTKRMNTSPKPEHGCCAGENDDIGLLQIVDRAKIQEVIVSAPAASCSIRLK